MSIRSYIDLTKPGIIGGNLLVAAAGFALGSATPDWSTFFSLLLGLGLVIASACVCNNAYDRDIDARMERTKERAFPAGKVSLQQAILFASALLTGGIVLLSHINIWTLGVALAGFVVYVFFYTPFKHRSSYALYVGAIAGATPPVVGYAAAAGTLDWIAGLLFILLFIWQLPHFIAIALYRYDEYAAAGVPMLVQRPRSERVRRVARQVFLGSLVVLTLPSLGVMLYRFLL